MTLAYAGSRLSEALALTADRVDLAAGVLVFETLKKRQAGIYRAVPVPALLNALDLMHGIRKLHARRGEGRGIRLWPWSRMTGWRAVHAVSWRQPISMARGPHQRGCATASAWLPSPPVFLSTWCRNGSATPSSPNAIYADATGVEEKDIAQRMWVASERGVGGLVPTA
jgi:integrase/recombinase XerD